MLEMVLLTDPFLKHFLDESVKRPLKKRTYQNLRRWDNPGLKVPDGKKPAQPFPSKLSVG